MPSPMLRTEFSSRRSRMERKPLRCATSKVRKPLESAMTAELSSRVRRSRWIERRGLRTLATIASSQAGAAIPSSSIRWAP